MSKGFLTIAQNNRTCDYLQLAYLQALSIKLVMPQAKYAVVTDEATSQLVTDTHRRVFDHVIVLPTDLAEDQEWKQRNEGQLFDFSPFRETIKLESDLLFTRNVDHWWTALQHRDVVFSLGCRDYQGKLSTNRQYRRIFDANGLPDIYSGMMYWRRSDTAYKLFNVAKQIYELWDEVKHELKFAKDDPGSNDLVFSIAAHIVGVQNVTIPSLEFFNFTHCKPYINRFNPALTFDEAFNVEVVPPSIRINLVDQEYPVHYYNKKWATAELIKRYEDAVFV